MKKLLNRNLLIRLYLILFIFIIFLLVGFYWQINCVDGGCSYYLMDKILDPLYYASLSLLTFFIFFLFLPFHYFKQWLNWIFSWGIIASFAIVYANLHGEGSPLPIFARETIIILTVIFWIITLLFCIFLWWRGRRPGRR